MRPHTKREVKPASPTLPARHATQKHFFLNPTSEIEILDGYLAFPMSEQVYNFMWWWLDGVAELCIDLGGAGGRAPHVYDQFGRGRGAAPRT